MARKILVYGQTWLEIKPILMIQVLADYPVRFIMGHRVEMCSNRSIDTGQESPSDTWKTKHNLAANLDFVRRELDVKQQHNESPPPIWRDIPIKIWHISYKNKGHSLTKQSGNVLHKLSRYADMFIAHLIIWGMGNELWNRKRNALG